MTEVATPVLFEQLSIGTHATYKGFGTVIETRSDKVLLASREVAAVGLGATLEYGIHHQLVVEKVQIPDMRSGILPGTKLLCLAALAQSTKDGHLYPDFYILPTPQAQIFPKHVHVN